jgi:hypothetical protein
MSALMKAGLRSAMKKFNKSQPKPPSKPRNQSPVIKEIVAGKGKTQQASPTAQRKRKGEGQQAADLNQPAAGSVGKGAEQADAGLPASKVAAKQAGDFDKDLAKTKKLIKKYTEQLKELKNPTGKDRFKGSKAYENRMEKIKSVQTLLTQAKQKVADKKSRGGPGGKSKLTTAQRKVIGKKQGGSLKSVNQTKNPGLAKLPKPVRNKMGFAKKGGKISYRKGGGQALVASLYD